METIIEKYNKYRQESCIELAQLISAEVALLGEEISDLKNRALIANLKEKL